MEQVNCQSKQTGGQEEDRQGYRQADRQRPLKKKFPELEYNTGTL